MRGRIHKLAVEKGYEVTIRPRCRQGYAIEGIALKVGRMN
jgi:hypothetical protein